MTLRHAFDLGKVFGEDWSYLIDFAGAAGRAGVKQHRQPFGKDQRRIFNEQRINQAQYDSLRKAIKGENENLKAIIKTDKDAKYRNMIDIVDEMDISGIGSYGVMDSLKVEEQVLLDIQKANL